MPEDITTLHGTIPAKGTVTGERTVREAELEMALRAIKHLAVATGCGCAIIHKIANDALTGSGQD